MHALPALCASPATLVSCSVTPSVASIMMTHTSARSTASSERITENFSIFSSTLALFADAGGVDEGELAVFDCPRSASTLSRVVPATLETMTRSSPSTRLSRLDLPTFGLPMRATRMRSLVLFVLVLPAGNARRPHRAARPCRSRAARKCRTARPDQGCRTHRIPPVGSPGLSHLLTASTIGLPERSSMDATS